MKEAITLHSSWRAASTYVWAKFRQRCDAYGYFEPLNEHLAKATKELVDGFRPWSFAHHPALDAPYLEEFRPLLRPEGGIPGFPTPLTYGRYCASHDAILPELETYLAALAGLAARQGRRPVYGFVRTDLRVGWFRRQIPGCHIFIRREPRRQFLSMLGQAKLGNPYFLLRPLAILKQNRDEPALAPLLASFDLASILGSSGLRALLKGVLTPETPLATLYVIFYFMRVLARERGEAHCDLIIDIDRLSLDPSYRRKTETSVGDLTGMAISFADCHVERYPEVLDRNEGFFDAFERNIESGKLAVAAMPFAASPGPGVMSRDLRTACDQHVN